VTGTVVTVDHFGNLITNIEARYLEALVHPVLASPAGTCRCGAPTRRPAGRLPRLVNSFGVLEIARAERSAAEGLGLARGHL